MPFGILIDDHDHALGIILPKNGEGTQGEGKSHLYREIRMTDGLTNFNTFPSPSPEAKRNTRRAGRGEVESLVLIK